MRLPVKLPDPLSDPGPPMKRSGDVLSWGPAERGPDITIIHPLMLGQAMGEGWRGGSGWNAACGTKARRRFRQEPSARM